MSGCSPRPHVGTERDHPRDGGVPAVVYVDRVRPSAVNHPGPPSALSTAEVVPEQEPNDTLARAQSLEFPKGVQGTIGAPHVVAGKSVGDVDWYQWLPSSGSGLQIARVELTRLATTHLALAIFDGDGKLIANGGEGEAAIVVPDLAVTLGTPVFLRVSEEGPPHGDADHPYRLVVTTAPRDPSQCASPDVGAALALPVVAGGEASGSFGAAKAEHWLHVLPSATSISDGGALPPPPLALAPGAGLRLDLDGVEGVAAEISVRTLEGKELSSAKGARGQPVRMRNAPLGAGGTPSGEGVLVVVRATAGFSTELRWLLRTQIETPPPGPPLEIEPNDTVATANPLVPGTAGDAATGVRGYLWPGDVDVFRVHVDEPTALRIELAPPEASHADVRLEILDAARKKPVLTVDDRGAGQGEVVPTWWVSGDLLVRVSGRKEAIFDAPYAIFASAVTDPLAEREPNDDAAHATRVEGASEVHGWITPRGDVDWYSLGPPEGAHTIHATLGGAPGGTTLRLVDGAGKTLASGLTIAAPLVSGAQLVVKGGDAAREAYTLAIRYE